MVGNVLRFGAEDEVSAFQVQQTGGNGLLQGDIVVQRARVQEAVATDLTGVITVGDWE